MKKKISLLNKQGSKQFNILNMKPCVKLTKKQHKQSSRLNYVYGLEFQKKLYRQNLIRLQNYNSFDSNIQCFKNGKNLFSRVTCVEKEYAFSSITSYSSFLNNSSLWPIQKQTTALKVFPQSSLFWLYSLYQLDSVFTRSPDQDSMSNINKKNKLWTAGFVKIRKLRQYYGKQLQSTNKLLYWLGDPSYRQLRKALNKIYTHAYSNIMPWSIIQFLDSLWTNLQIKANFVYYSSASPNVLKQKKMRYNGLIIQRPYGFCEAGDLIYTKKKV
jgi:hypothetical protein